MERKSKIDKYKDASCIIIDNMDYENRKDIHQNISRLTLFTDTDLRFPVVMKHFRC